MSSETFKDEKEDLLMYWCRKCRCYHSGNSDIGMRHKVYSGGTRRPRRSPTKRWRW